METSLIIPATSPRRTVGYLYRFLHYKQR